MYLDKKKKDDEFTPAEVKLIENAFNNFIIKERNSVKAIDDVLANMDYARYRRGTQQYKKELNEIIFDKCLTITELIISDLIERLDGEDAEGRAYF